MERFILCYPGEYTVITRVVTRERKAVSKSKQCSTLRKSQERTTGLENGSGPEPRNFKASKNYKKMDSTLERITALLT